MVMNYFLTSLLEGIAFVGLFFLIFLLSKWAKDFFTPYNLNDELTEKDNLSVSLTMAGYYFAVTLIFIGSLLGSSKGVVIDLIWVSAYSALGLVFLNVSRFFNDKFILREFCNIEQLTEEQNVAVGAVQFGTYVATGLVAAASVYGEGPWFTAILSFVCGQALLFLFSVYYDFLTPFSLHEELKKKNVAAGIAFGGSSIAFCIILVGGFAGDFISFKDSAVSLLIVMGVAFTALPLIRLIMDKLVIPRSNLSSEIVDDQNVGAGILEATVAISFAIVINILL